MTQTLLYGGTFDPIHHGHLILCRRAREILGHDRVLMMPARVSPHKSIEQLGAAGEHRLAMIQLAIENAPDFAVDTRELDRPGPSYTFDTLEELRSEFPGEPFTLLIGTDQLPKLHLWRRAADLLRGPIAILPRSQGVPIDWDDIARNAGQTTADRLRQSVLATPRIDISATDIRERCRRNLAIDYLVPRNVADYIRAHHLYRPTR